MNENEEIQINFRDYMLYSLKRWRSILVIALLCALAAAGIVVAKSAISWDENLKKYDEEVEKYNEEHEIYEDNLVAFSLALDNFKRNYEDAEEYSDNSILIGLDANYYMAVNTDLMLLKKETEEDSSDTIDQNNVLKAYYNCLYEYADWDAVGELIHVKSEYAKELVDAQIDYDGGTISLKVIYPDEGYSYAISEMLINGANTKMNEYGYFGGYDMVLINQSSGYEYSKELMDFINEKKSAFEKAKTDYESGQENLERYVSEEEPKQPTMDKSLSRKHIAVVAIIVGIIGFVVGAFLMFVFYYNRFVKKGIIYSANEFNRITGINSLGVFPKAGEKKRLFGFIDRAISNKSKDTSYTEDFAYERIKIHLDNLKDVENIIIVGKNNDKCNGIFEKLGKDIADKKFNMYEDFSSNEALKDFYDCDGVIFIVEREKTMLSEMISNQRFVENNKKNIIGNIVL